MIVYLDQNKWIELARIENGKDDSTKAKQLLREIRAARECGYIFPLSGIHITEFARIKDDARRSRLGKVMWQYSEGTTTTPLKEILCWELENAFAKNGYQIKSAEFSYLGYGLAHAFGEELDSPGAALLADKMDEAIFCGLNGLPPMQSVSSKYRENFANHLRSLHKTKKELDPSKWENWLYAISMADITEPFYIVMNRHRIPNSDMEAWSEKKLKAFMDAVPTRSLDIHLHRQVLKKPDYNPKITDLEDWAGLGPAACYADIVVCEKHFADLVQRDGYRPKARIITSIYDIFPKLTAS